MFFIVGLGNPGPEYERTRHNTGRIVLNVFAKSFGFPELKDDTTLTALVSRGEVMARKGSGGKKQKVILVEPETFMNKSGEALRRIKDLRCKTANKKKEVENLAVIHDDLDIPFGSYKISFNKSSGGHRGVESIIRALKTRGFARIRVGIAASASAVRKPQNDISVEKTILGAFTESEMAGLKKLAKKISEGLAVLVTEGREKAMSQYQG